LSSAIESATPSPELDLLAYIDQVPRYIRTHHIDAIYYSRDMADLAAAALRGVWFPVQSIESVFLCIHKYYSRRSEPAIAVTISICMM
jgi:hypothetical protein